MSAHEIIFIILSVIIVVFSIMTITTQKILRAATYLLFVLLATAGIYFGLDYNFLGAVQIGLYAGGIVVIIVFSILLTHHIHHKMAPPHWSRLLGGVGVAVLGSAISIFTILSYDFKTPELAPLTVDVRTLGLQMVGTGENGYALPFEVISILLLAALIGAIIIAKKEKVNPDSETKQ
jgi:NADH-quinone oxidoreductase subunit J